MQKNFICRKEEVTSLLFGGKFRPILCLLPYSDEKAHRNKEGGRLKEIWDNKSPFLSRRFGIGKDLGWVKGSS
jgi:hypothetical protein